MGQTLVLMARGIDLSAPAIIALSSTVLLGVSGGHDDRMAIAIGVALLAAVAVGLVNGLLVALLKLNALIVTLSTGAIVSGVTLCIVKVWPQSPRFLASSPILAARGFLACRFRSGSSPC